MWIKCQNYNFYRLESFQNITPDEIAITAIDNGYLVMALPSIPWFMWAIRA